MLSFLRARPGSRRTSQSDRSADIEVIHQARATFSSWPDAALADALRTAAAAAEGVALASVVASRRLGLDMFDEQLLAALELIDGHVVEMQTGEGKTLAAVPAAAWLARTGRGVHVMTANDYLARRDGAWMGPVYEGLGLTVGAIHQDQSTADRRRAYRADVTYATAAEIGFDYLRDALATDTAGQVHRAFDVALIDEADSILIDEARVPLVVAAGSADGDDIALHAERTVRQCVPGHHYTVEGHGRQVLLTPAGAGLVERAFGRDNLFATAADEVHAAVHDALHAHALLRRDVDYVVSDGVVLPVDEHRGRVVPDRRWPAGLQTAIEVKEGVRRRPQGRVYGSITIENLIGLYTSVCGMTGTAASEADQFREMYELEVCGIPPHRPVIRQDDADEVFETKAEKEEAVVREIRSTHERGRPVLVGTASVEESERFSRRLADLPHHVLNARNEAAEAAIIAKAGERGAVTISTNMAGRGVDIRLGDGVAALGGLHVIGTNRHDSRRIDDQLRGRAGRQGDPGSSRFFVSREDPLFSRYADGDAAMSADQCQRVAEGESLEVRMFLRRYEWVIEAQRREIAEARQRVVEAAGAASGPDERARLVRLAVVDDLWSDYLAAVTELRSGSPWISLGYGDPLGHYLREVHAMFARMQASIEPEVAERLASTGSAPDPPGRGATWTYLTHDEPFGRMTERIIRQLVERFRANRGTMDQ